PPGRVAVPHGDVVDDHGAARDGGVRRGGAAGDPVRERAAHRDVEQQEVAAVRGHVVPGRGADPVLADGVVPLVVDVPAQLLGGDAAVPLEPVGVHPGLAGRAGAGAGRADAVALVAGTARVRPAVQDAPHRVDPVDVLHDVEL